MGVFYRPVGAGESGVRRQHPQIFTDQITLSNQAGDYAHHINTTPHLILRPLYGPVLHHRCVLSTGISIKGSTLVDIKVN